MDHPAHGGDETYLKITSRWRLQALLKSVKRIKWRNYYIIALLLVLIGTVDSNLSYLLAFDTQNDQIILSVSLWDRNQTIFQL